MPGGRKKNNKKKEGNINETALLNHLRNIMEDLNEASGALQEAFVRGDFDRMPHFQRLKEISVMFSLLLTSVLMNDFLR